MERGSMERFCELVEEYITLISARHCYNPYARIVHVGNTPSTRGMWRMVEILEEIRGDGPGYRAWGEYGLCLHGFCKRVKEEYRTAKRYLRVGASYAHRDRDIPGLSFEYYSYAAELPNNVAVLNRVSKEEWRLAELKRYVRDVLVKEKRVRWVCGWCDCGIIVGSGCTLAVGGARLRFCNTDCLSEYVVEHFV